MKRYKIGGKKCFQFELAGSGFLHCTPTPRWNASEPSEVKEQMKDAVRRARADPLVVRDRLFQDVDLERNIPDERL